MDTVLYTDTEGRLHDATIYPDNPDLPCCPNANHRLIRLDTGEMLVVHKDTLKQGETE